MIGYDDFATVGKRTGTLFLKKILSAAVACASLLAACATLDSAKAPDANVKGLKSFYVVRVPEDERGIEKLIATRLSGYQ